MLRVGSGGLVKEPAGLGMCVWDLQSLRESGVGVCRGWGDVLQFEGVPGEEFARIGAEGD